jgi:hypothetical protein
VTLRFFTRNNGLKATKPKLHERKLSDSPNSACRMQTSAIFKTTGTATATKTERKTKCL